MRVRKFVKSYYQLRHVCLSVCLSAWNSSSPTGQIFIEVNTPGFFENLSRQFEVSLKSVKNNGHMI